MSATGRPQRRSIVIKPAVPMTSDINVTPLVDVVLVLLIIFMVVAPLQEKELAVEIPTTERVDTPTSETADQTVVRLDEQNRLYLNDDQVAPEALGEQLGARLSPLPREKRVVFFLTDDRASFRNLVAAFDTALEAGAASIAYATADEAGEANEANEGGGGKGSGAAPAGTTAK